MSASPEETPALDQPPEPDLEIRKEWTRLRALLYGTGDLSLSTDPRDKHRWLTDRYVLLDVTGSLAVEDKPDGLYKLVQSGKNGSGLLPKEGVNFLGAGIVDYLDNIESHAVWSEVKPSQWSVAEHPGKAMLVSVRGTPRLVGEGTWAALHRHYEEPVVEYDIGKTSNVFRVRTGFPGPVVAYVAGIRIPDGQEAIARAIALLVDGDATSNYNSAP